MMKNDSERLRPGLVVLLGQIIGVIFHLAEGWPQRSAAGAWTGEMFSEKRLTSHSHTVGDQIRNAMRYLEEAENASQLNQTLSSRTKSKLRECIEKFIQIQNAHIVFTTSKFQRSKVVEGTARAIPERSDSALSFKPMTRQGREDHFVYHFVTSYHC
ncbi:hypothetical protein P153DRAFT_44368 [Dothidotthia symphoricarpi CBS 119687]|uniref:Uncharacterized protein n=1 Tax=Dothidotthia symphoricarpi CBS 119687 TaxID=1392245 RepID=A0A6A6A7G3_9PLEO|nr:uncharacterized protein P153DRAFT_44368 [Dothidotthia symphoricarpi CBS 119687]KAF2127942.1 hypothetical protein P153DRAFT_44368 [Dothidotthia symphoricarpi CBS 119687]